MSLVRDETRDEIRGEENDPATCGRGPGCGTGEQSASDADSVDSAMHSSDGTRIEWVIRTLAEWLEQARLHMKGREVAGERDGTGMADMTKIGVMVARVSDVLVKALLAQARLAAQPAFDDRAARLSAELERVLVELGLGEEDREHTQGEGKSR